MFCHKRKLCNLTLSLSPASYFHIVTYQYFSYASYPVDISGNVVGESSDCLLLSGTVVGENPDHVCWVLL